MSYNGTVRCSYCYQKGHNRRTCPELKKFIEENPDSWRAVQARDAKARASKRKCSWCNQSGHNARTCPVKAEMTRVVKQNNDVTSEIAQKILTRFGIGRGAVVRFDEYGGERGNVGIVLGFVPDNCASVYSHGSSGTFREPKLWVWRQDLGQRVEAWMPCPPEGACNELRNTVKDYDPEMEKDVRNYSAIASWGFSNTKLVVPSRVPPEPVSTTRFVLADGARHYTPSQVEDTNKLAGKVLAALVAEENKKEKK